MQRNSEEGSMITSGCSSCRNENAIFLLLHWFKHESSFTLYFSCLAIQVYRVTAVCFVILTVKEACEGPTQVSRSEGRTKITCCVVV